MRALFVLNPAAGHGRAARRWEAASQGILSRHPDFQMVRTSYPGHGAELCRRGLADGFEAILAVGGDGTLGEVVDGYLSSAPELRRKCAVGTWPAGSGCDAARHFGIGGGTEALEGLLEKHDVLNLDAAAAEFTHEGKIRRRHFFNMAALGLAGDVARRMERWGKPLGGALSYFLFSGLSLLAAKPYDLSFDIDGEEVSGRYHLAVAANTRSFGGGMKIAPEASAEDGLLDLVLVEGVSRWQLLRRFPAVYAGRHAGVPGISIRRVRRLAVRSRRRVLLNIDGEAMGELPAAFSAMPGALRFLLPARGPGPRS